jgi:hypothetical protein
VLLQIPALQERFWSLSGEAHALSDLQAEVAHLEVLAQQAAQARHDLVALRAEADEAEALQAEVEQLRGKVGPPQCLCVELLVCGTVTRAVLLSLPLPLQPAATALVSLEALLLSVCMAVTPCVATISTPAPAWPPTI